MTSAVTRFYVMHGIRARVDWSAEVLPAVEAILEYHGFAETEASGDIDWFARLDRGGRRPFVPTMRGAAADPQTGLSIFRQGSVLYIAGDDAVAVVSNDEQLVLWISDDIAADRSRLPPILYFVLTFALLGLLQRRAMFAVHGAALGLDESRGLLLIGESDTGKSTLAMTLVRSGWRYLSDDSIFLCPNGDDPIEAIPFRRDFGFDADAEVLFPELRETSESQLTDARKRRVRVDALYPLQYMERCIPRVIVFPTVAPSEASRVSPIRPTDALRRLMTQSSFVDMDADLARNQMDVLQRTIRQCRCLALVAGADLKGVPEAADALLRPLLEAPA